jgi:peptidoglycan/LPS O-acetylase OafA/YrhL
MHEFWVNVVYAVLQPWLTVRRLAFLVVALYAAVAVLSLGVFHAWCGPYWTLADLLIGGTRALYGIFMGILLFKTRTRWEPWLSGRLHHSLVILALLVLVDVPPLGTYDPIFNVVVTGAVMPLLVACGASATVPAGPARFYAFCGTTSYALYILHQPIYHALVNTLKHVDDRIPYGGAAIFFVIAVAAAVAADLFYDIPVRNWLTRLTRPAKPAGT